MDAELAVDAGEVGFDRVDADVESGGDLLVGEALGSEGGEPCFSRREVACGGATPADACQLVAGATGPEAGAEAVEDPVRFVEVLAGRALLTRPTSDRSGCQECASVLEWAAHASVLGQRPVERFACAFDVVARPAAQPAAAGSRGDRQRSPEYWPHVFVALVPCLQLLTKADYDH